MPISEKIPKNSKKSKNKNNKSKQNREEKNSAGKRLGGLLFLKMARGARSELGSNAERVNRLNVFPVADGDTGDNMRLTIESGISAIENLDTDDLAHVIKVFSHGMLLGARGNSGVILSQLFSGMAEGLSAESSADPYAIGRALEMGVERAYTSVLTPTEGTILTVARESVAYAVSRLTPHSTVRSLFRDLVSEMHRSLHRTPDLLEVLRQAGVVDSGGAGLYYIMDGFYRVLCGEQIGEEHVLSVTDKSTPSPSLIGTQQLKYGYCTELLLSPWKSREEGEPFVMNTFREFLCRHGDSVVLCEADGLVKVHVHTNTPERILARAHRYGEFVSVKIENMSVQHTAFVEQIEKAPPAQPKKYGVVSVSFGDGLSALLRELGSDAIVDCTENENPSTKELLDTYARVRAEHIFVLPNHANIILSAEQSAKIYDAAEIHVIHAKSVGAGICALCAMDLSLDDPNAIVAHVTEAMRNVRTGYIAPAARDAQMSGVTVRSGDTVGVIDKEIVLSEPDRPSAVCALAQRLLEGGEYSLFSLIVGEDGEAAEIDALRACLAAGHPDTELSVIDGRQRRPTYIMLAQ